MTKEQKNPNGVKTKVRFLKLFVLACTKWILGVRASAFGASIPALQTYFDTSLSVISCLFMTFGVGSTTAAFLSAFLYKWFDVTLLLAVAVFVYGLGLTLMLSTRNIIFAFVCTALIGAGGGITLNGSMSYTNALFPDEHYAFHCLAMSIACGLVSGPLIAYHFLDSDFSGMVTQQINSTRETLTNTTVDNTTSSSIGNSTGVFYLYVTIGLANVPLVIAYCAVFLNERGKEKVCIPQKQKFKDIDGQFTWSKLIFIGILLSIMPSIYGLASVHGSYITTIAETGHLQLSISKATSITSLYMLTYLLSRFCSIGISMLGKHVTIMYMCLIGPIASLAVLLMSGHNSEIYFWVGSLSFGFFCGPQFPTLMTWCREYVTLTPLLMGMFTSMDFMGTTFLPFIAGELISWRNEDWEVYFCLCLSIYTLLAFSCAHVIGNFKLK